MPTIPTTIKKLNNIIAGSIYYLLVLLYNSNPIINMMTVDMIPNISINILSSVKSNKVLNTTPAKTNLAMSMKKSPSFSLMDIVFDLSNFFIIFDFDSFVFTYKYRRSFMIFK